MAASGTSSSITILRDSRASILGSRPPGAPASGRFPPPAASALVLLLALHLLPEFLLRNALPGSNPLPGGLEDCLQSRGMGHDQPLNLVLVAHGQQDCHRLAIAGDDDRPL